MFMDLRGSDAGRGEAIERLREAATEGRLTFEELADRIELAANAVTRAELIPLTADLPTALTLHPAEPIRVRMSGDIKRSGAWVVPAESSFRSYFGHVKLDLREATITVQEIRIDAFTPFGNIDLLVPEGVHIDVRANARLGKLKV